MDVSTSDDAVPPRSRVSLLLPLCSAALFLSALILFAIQPMFTKMILPLMGGTPAVWNTAVMFFQAVLLAGYLYAHLLSRLGGLRRQVPIHIAVLVLGFLFLPVHVAWDWTPTASTHPIPWLIALLAVSIGVPFFAISATAPLLQKWFSHSGHPHASDPYFLYVSSNIGGLAALLAYPVVIEPLFGLTLQGRLWAIGYGTLAVLIVSYALCLWRARRSVLEADPQFDARRSSERSANEFKLARRVSWTTRAHWVALAFVPSALLLAVTLHISTDVASAPFLWVAPLLLYSLSFILVFARRPLLKHGWMLAVQPWIYAWVALYFTQSDNLAFTLALHLLTLFTAAMVCHGELVRHRPTVEHLTEFYLWMSLGGLLGGVFCALIAPVVFNGVLEYPLVLALGCLLLPSTRRVSARGRAARVLAHWLEKSSFVCWWRGSFRRAVAVLVVSNARRAWLGYSLDVALPAAFAGLYFLAQAHENLWDLAHASELGFYLAMGVVLFACRRRPLRFTLIFGVLLFSTVRQEEMENQLFRQRSFFGVYTVTTDESRTIHKLYHGTTLHGDQDMDPENLLSPRTYYDLQGPLAQVFQAMRAVRKLDHVGVMGLGTGTTTCYQESGQKMTFFEIDPTIERMARDPNLFRYLELCEPQVQVIIGDGRQNLRRMPDKTFNLLILDAFSSDAIPVHLLTREALAIYLHKLTPGGIVLFHISNRYVDLEPVVANLALDAGVAALIQEYEPSSDDETTWGASSSTWVAVARDTSDLGLLTADDRWCPPEPNPAVGVWTDDYSNIFKTLMWDWDDLFQLFR